MKPLFLLCFLLALAGKTYGQSIITCGIFYSYDANGERILRKDDCVGDEQQNPVDKPLHAILYPNPTAGPFHVAFNELVLSARMTIHTIDGRLLTVVEMGEGYEMHYDITNQARASYLVDLFVRREDGSQATQEFLLIKDE